jgi:prevent-host-death family protein
MRSVGVRELKEQIGKILRRVRQDGETIEVTYRGRVVARVVPANPVPKQAKSLSPEESAAFWAEWDELGAEISKDWPKGVSAVDAVREQRRDL